MSPMKNPKFRVAASRTKKPKTTFSRFTPTPPSGPLKRVQGDGDRGRDAEVQAWVGNGHRVPVADRLLPLTDQHDGAGAVVDEIEVEDEGHPDVADVRDEVPDPAEDRDDRTALPPDGVDARRRQVPGRAEQARAEVLLEPAQRPTGLVEDVVLGVDVESLPGPEGEHRAALRLVGVEDHLLLELH